MDPEKKENATYYITKRNTYIALRYGVHSKEVTNSKNKEFYKK